MYSNLGTSHDQKEAKELSIGVDLIFTIDSFIDKIYSDINSQTCENCKWYIFDAYFKSDNKDCAANLMAQSVVSFPPKDFGCNRFESK